MVYKLNIIQDGEEQGSFLVGHRQFAKVSAQQGMLIQVINEKGELVSAPKTKAVGNDLWVILEGDERRPEIIIENYTQFSPIADANSLKGLNATLAMTGAVAAGKPTLAEETQDEVQENLIEKPQEGLGDNNAMDTPETQANDLAPEGGRNAELAQEIQQPDAVDNAGDGASQEASAADAGSTGGYGSWIGLAGVAAIGVGVIAATHDSDDDDGEATTLPEADNSQAFVFNDFLLSADDTIGDFDASKDVIQLKQDAFDQLTAKGVLSDDMRDDYFSYDKATGELQYDTNGPSEAGGYQTFAVLEGFEGGIADIHFEVI